jgi:hypothetical protein
MVENPSDIVHGMWSNYSIHATFITSCNKTQFRALDVIVAHRSSQININRISTIRIYFDFFRGIERTH